MCYEQDCLQQVCPEKQILNRTVHKSGLSGKYVEHSFGDDEICLLGSYAVFFYTWYTGLEGYIMKRWNSARDLVDMASHPMG